MSIGAAATARVVAMSHQPASEVVRTDSSWHSTSISSMLVLSAALHLTLLVAAGMLFTKASFQTNASGVAAAAHKASLTVDIGSETALRVRSRKSIDKVSATGRLAKDDAEVRGSGVPTSVPGRSSDAPALTLAPEYRLSSQLDARPSPLAEISPIYPARAGKQDGSVVLRLLIDETGRVDRIAVIRAFPSGYFEDAAIDAFRGAMFSPGTFLGAPVKSQLLVELNFEVPDRPGKDLR